MINPVSFREVWREFEQKMQDWQMRVAAVAEEDGWDYIGASDSFADLFHFTGNRFMDGKNCMHPEDEFQAFLDWTETSQYREYWNENYG